MSGMRAIVVVLGLSVLVGLVAYFVFASGDVGAPPQPPAGSAPAGVGPTAPPEQGSTRSAVPMPTPEPQAHPGDARPTPPTEPEPEANVVLAVRELTTRLPVAAFHWQFRNSRGTLRGDGRDGKAGLALEPSAVGQLLVEAEGLAPLVKEGVIVPTPPAGAATIDLFLAPAVATAGIALYVRDLALAPITDVRVDAFALAEEAPGNGWHLGQALWARRTSAPDGRYPLPTLPAGSYGIRVIAIDSQGASLPLQPYLRTFTLTGDNGFVEDVALEPGALLSLELVDAAGQPFDATQRGTATLDLRLVGGPAVRRKWLVRHDAGEAAAIDVVPGIGKVQLADAVVAGPYQIDVLVNGAPRVRARQLFLRPGVTNEERIVVP
jgi:hypothetical protein